MDWFRDTTLLSIKITELMDALNVKDSVIKLPSFQRDAVWNEEYVEFLWDSIMRGFPIGSLLFASTKDFNVEDMGVRSLQDSFVSEPNPIQRCSSRTKYIIIDGQQRCIALSLGFREHMRGDSVRLWIDIGYNHDIKEKFKFRFYVCSQTKPWGNNVNTADLKKVLSQLKREDDFDRESNEILSKTWPLKAQIPISFFEFYNSVIKNGLSDWTAFLPENMPQEIKDTYSNSPIDITNIIEGIKSLLNYQIPIHLIEGLQDLEELAEAFHRINKSGVPMLGEDLFFSGLKMKWPEAHDLVWDIYKDKETGRFLSPTKIVHNVVRLTAANGISDKVKDVPRLDLHEFRKLIKPTSDENNPFLENLKSYLEKNNNISIYHSKLQKAKSFLIYNPELANDKSDIGLPITLLARLDKRVWHTITAWIDNHKEVELGSEIGKQSRKEMIRYALYDHLYIKRQSTRYLTEPFKKAVDKGKNIFPGAEIFLSLLVSDSNLNLLTLDDFELSLYDRDNNPVGDILNNERDILMWNQRIYLHEWFPKFDPTLYPVTSDLPYDIDHILARYYFNMQGSSKISRDISQRNPKYRLVKDRLLSCSGNLRFWPKNLNRSDNYANLEKKSILGDFYAVTISDSYLRKIGLNTIGDVRNASIISENDLEHWNKVPKKHQDWLSENSINAFIAAVQTRRIFNYKNLYEEIGWGEWNKLKSETDDKNQ